MRLPRLSVANIPQHVIVRGHNGEPIFKSAHDCKSYLYFLKEVADKNNADVHAYILMPNHVHFLMSSDNDNGVGRTVQALARHYVPYFNQRYERRGALFNARYRSALVERGDPVLQVYRYIEENAVRCRLCEHPADYQWSSYSVNALGAQSELVSAAEEYQLLGMGNEQCCDRYSSLFAEPQDQEQLNYIRKQTNRSWVIGSESFREIVEQRFGVCLREKKRGGDRRSKAFRQTNLAEVMV